MFDVVQSVGDVAQLAKIRIDYNVFRLHYTFTVVMLLTFFVILTSTQIVGSPIACEYSTDKNLMELLDTYCYIHATFLNPDAFGKSVGDEIPHPGIDSSQNPTQFRYYRYYQWVYFIFFLQAFMFYIPEWLWKIWEGQKINNLVSSFEDVLLNETERRRKMDTIIRYLTKTWKMHYWYAVKYIFCEFLSLSNVVGQMYLLDKFFDGRFKTFGIRVVQFSRTQKQFTTYSNTTLNSKWDPKIMLFPRVTKCMFRRYGKTSNIETYDALCIMSLNIISEKLFIFLWFWLVILAALSSINLLVNLILVVIPIFRTYALRLRLHHINFTKLHALIMHGNYGDFFLLDLLSLNVDNILFTELVREISNELPGKQIVLQI